VAQGQMQHNLRPNGP